MNFSFGNVDKLSDYMIMLNNEHILGTNDYRPQNKNQKYWDFLLGPVKNNSEFWNGKKALDFGTGLGRNIENLIYLSKWDSLYAVDLSQKNVEKLKSTFPSNCNFFKTNGRNLKIFKDNSFDFVISTLVFQHLAVYELRLELLKEIYRVMNQDAIFTFQMGYGNDLNERAYPNHYFCLMRTGTLTTPSRLKVADYYENIYDAIGSNGELDCRVTNPNQIISDLNNIGFKNIEYIIDDSFDDYIHKKWIYLKAEK